VGDGDASSDGAGPRRPEHGRDPAAADDRRRFATQVAARLAVFDFIEGWYNPRRRHSALAYESPMRYEFTHRPQVA